MTKYKKLLVLFIILLFAFMSFAVAGNVTDSTSVKKMTKDVKKVESSNDKISDTKKVVDKKCDNNRKWVKNVTKARMKSEASTSKVKQDKLSDKNVKCSDEPIVEEVNVTEDNFRQYFRVTSGTFRMSSGITSSNNNLTLNLQYFPDNVDYISIEGRSSKYLNRSVVIDGKDLPSLTNVEVYVSTNFNPVVLQNFNITYTSDYPGITVVTVEGEGNPVLRNMSFNVEKDILQGYAMNIIGRATLEGCYLRARCIESEIDWLSPPNLPVAYGVSVTTSNCLFKGNTFDILSCGNNTRSMYSLYAIYCRGVNNSFIDNDIMLSNCTGYAYCFVGRCVDCYLSRNRITASSVTYANGVNMEMSIFRGNVVRDNFVNVTASWGNAPWGNAGVAYAMQMLDPLYTGSSYVGDVRHPSNNSFINNTIVADAGQCYGIEIWGTVNTTLSENNIHLYGRAPMGIGMIGYNISATKNNIIIEGTHNHTEPTADYLGALSTGIFAGYSVGGVTIANNTIYVNNSKGMDIVKSPIEYLIENNTVVVDNHDYAIEIEGSDNIVRNNVLNARNHKADGAVYDTGNNNNVYDNSNFRVSQMRLIAQDHADIKDSVPLLIVLKEDNNNVMSDTLLTLTINGMEIPLVTDDYGMCTYNYTPTTTETVDITATYKNNEIFLGSISSMQITITDKDAIISELNNNIQEQEETIQEQEEIINNKNTTVTQKQSEITQKEQETQALNNTVNQLQEELKDTTNQIKKQNNTNNNNNQNGTTKTKSDITITITPDKKTLKAGQKVTLNIKMTDKKTSKAVTSATLNIKIGSKTVKATLKNGVAKVIYTVPRGCDAQTVKVSTSYSSDKYNKQTANTQFKVTKTTPTIKKTSITYKNKKTSIKATIKDATKKLLNKNVKVTVKVDGKVVLKNKVIKNGKISLSFKKALKKGNHKLLITSSATKAFNASKLSAKFKV